MDFFNKSEQSILLNAENIIVGFSGGVDSTLVLAATNQFLEAHNKKNCLTALHVNHQTQSDSSSWQKHCEKFCKEHNINFTDWGDIGVSGWHQIFFHDPDGNIIEVHQKI